MFESDSNNLTPTTNNSNPSAISNMKAIILCGAGNTGKTSTINYFINHHILPNPAKFIVHYANTTFTIIERITDGAIIVILPHGDYSQQIEWFFKEISKIIITKRLPNYTHIIGTSRTKGSSPEYYWNLLGNGQNIYWLGKERSNNLPPRNEQYIFEAMALAINDLLDKI